jgi:putative component of membrane protein insertase Oxa1/YidC/SpoIIIJ protein YidD
MAFRLLFLLLPFFLQASAGYFEPWGKDQDLKDPSLQTHAMKKASLPTAIFDGIILFHQKVISPIDGPRSHFRPTSSRYMQLAMQRYGFLKGYFMGFDRLMRENEEKWIYQNIVIDDVLYKYDPARIDKQTPPQ